MATGQEPTNGGEARGRAGGQARPREDLERIRQSAGEAREEVRQRGRDKLEQGKSVAADRADEVASTMEDVAQRLGDEHPSLASYAQQMSQSISRLADGLRNRSLDELAGEAQDIARRNPTLFVLSSVAIGVALSRFMKASARRPHGEAVHAEEPYDETGYVPPAGTAASPQADEPQSATPGVGFGPGYVPDSPDLESGVGTDKGI